MTSSFTSRLLKLSAANSVMKEGLARFGKNPKYPQDEQGIKALYDHLDKVVPKDAQSDGGIGKQIYLWLLKQLFNDPP
jgi:hypothetical protein